MKQSKIFILLFALLITCIYTFAQEKADSTAKSVKAKMKFQLASEYVPRKTAQIGVFYGGLATNHGKREFKSETYCPALTLVYNKAILKAFTVRLALGATVWREGWFTYHYWTPSFGMAYHFHLPVKGLEPYLGWAYSYRIAVVRNDCYNYHNQKGGGNMFIGLRYHLSHRFMLDTQLGSSENAYWKLGLTYSIKTQKPL